MTAPDARFALLERLIDHAPLFPPASLDLPEALEEDRRARESDAAFMLGRFVCPASRLEELSNGRALSVVLDAPLAADPRVEAVEAPASFVPRARLPSVPEIYVEVPTDGAVADRLDHLVERGLRAKVRCGGATVPTVGALARFIRSCRERGLAFKATAGLHQAVARDGEHGLLNLLAAVVFGDEERALADGDASAFALDPSGFRWRARSAGAEELARARRERLHSIGSCSFFEPVGELQALGMLPS
jgi:hypothetical protein